MAQTYYNFVLTILAIAVTNDLRYKKIDNYNTLPFIVFGLSRTFFYSFEAGIYLLFWLSVIFILGRLGFVGLGDLKLLMFITVFTDIEITAVTFLIANIIFVVYGLLFKKANSYLALQNLQTFITTKSTKSFTSERIPFAIFIAIGFVITIIAKCFI